MRGALLAAAVSASIATAGTAAAQDALQIGTAAIAKNAVSAILGSRQRNLKRGDALFQNDQVVTGNDSNAQVLFRDETALTMGPNSRVVLDKAVYDPDRKAGELALRAVSGAFRFVSGSGRRENYKITTPHGTIGIRGTILEFQVTREFLLLAVQQGGATYCTDPSRCVQITTPGNYIVSDGARVSQPQLITSPSCGTGNCQLLDLNKQTILQGPGPGGPSGGGPGTPLVTPNFRDLHRQYR